jgi:predicted ATP-dependent endonuclease of OLD family
MKQTLNEYNELALQTNRQLDKAYNKLEGPELDKAVQDLLVDSGTRVKQIIEELIAASEPSIVDTTNDESSKATTVQDLLDDLKEVAAGPLEFVFEDSEYTMTELTNLVK